MKLIKSIVRPNKVDEVKDALARLNISGMTVTEVRGHGLQKGHTAIYRGKEYNVSLLPKMEVEIVVNDSLADEAIKAIVEAARTGEIGDGRVFVFPVLESYRIRTGEPVRPACRFRRNGRRARSSAQLSWTCPAGLCDVSPPAPFQPSAVLKVERARPCNIRAYGFNSPR